MFSYFKKPGVEGGVQVGGRGSKEGGGLAKVIYDARCTMFGV